LFSLGSLAGRLSDSKEISSSNHCFLTFFQLHKTLGQRVHSVLGHGEDEPIGEALLQSGIGEETSDKFFQSSDPVAGGSCWRAIAAQQLHLESVAGAVEIFQVLSRADASQLTLHHYSDS